MDELAGEDGYELWLRYRKVDNPGQLAQYRTAIHSATVLGESVTADIIRTELTRALPVLLDNAVRVSEQRPAHHALVVGTADDLDAVGASLPQADYRTLGEEGFLIRSHQHAGNHWTLIAGNTEPAVLVGTFHLLRLLQTRRDIGTLDLSFCPRIRHRVLGHWDNLDGSIERGYAGRSLWNWDELPEIGGTRYQDYARACASLGINGTILNNVNAQGKSLTAEYLQKTAALADLFRPYGIRVYLSPLFSAPVQLGGLATSDPRNPAVAQWWKRKADEIYHLIPDFGGFEVKANSEGQPGPQDYGANHHDGASMLAAALEPHGGMVLWRAFVYDVATDPDRAKCAYKEFVPLDGRFRPNVFVQVKNGPIDFQPREPFHPLFGAMEKTPLALELQITQEYLGQSTHLVYLAGMWKEILDSDTYLRGPGSTVARIVDGTVNDHSTSTIVGVANTGSDRNWCGHHFAQANWYAYGRLAWDSDLSAEAIADEWVRMTWSNDPLVVNAIKTMMLGSWEACINYMTPLGLHHMMQEGHHYGPDPGFNAAPRADWNNVYYHRADAEGVGFDRSSTGSNAVSQYHSPLREQFDKVDTCPEELLLWFHHVPWDYRLRSGQTLWQELQRRYHTGVAFVQEMNSIWQRFQVKIDPRRHMHVSERLKQQLVNARLWRDVCIDYFGRFATRDCPFAMALRVLGLSDEAGEAEVLLPVPIEDVARRQTLETVFEAAYLEKDVYVYDEKIAIHWPEDLDTSASLMVRVQVPEGRIYSESMRMGAAGNQFNLGAAYQFREGFYQTVLMPQPKEYYEGNMRITRPIPVWTVRNCYSRQPYGTFTERRIEALYDAAWRQAGVYSEIAKMAVGRWQDVKGDTILEAIEGINQRRDCSDFYLVGLLGVLHRYGDFPEFPEELREPLEACVLDFKYWVDEPGEDVMWYWSENHQILFHACEILAGQLYPNRTFTNSGQTGQWHREKGERLALAWLRKRGAGGFQEWDSNCYFEEDLLALSHLADLTETPQVYELASVVMDKIFFTMALNSYKGVFGSTHGRTYSPDIKGGRLEATAGIGRLMWGMGAFNSHIRGTVSLACQEQYLLPPLLEAIAADLLEEMWNRERHAGEFKQDQDRTTGSWEVNKVTYKTPDYMLCSAQDYRPGERGSQQHIRQATMGPDAVVFVTHPACSSEEGSHRPGFWHGNVVLPRVAQWKDVLIAVHKLPEHDWMGFTHAYFPAAAFDEYTLREDTNGRTWAFARQGAGYLALTAAQGLEFTRQGDSAYRELRSYGQQNVWLCHMGRAALDGDFGTFQEEVLALDVVLEELAVRCGTLRGERLAFGWQGPLLRNEIEEPITGFRHYENPYCVADLAAMQMEIRYGDQLMRLSF